MGWGVLLAMKKAEARVVGFYGLNPCQMPAMLPLLLLVLLLLHGAKVQHFVSAQIDHRIRLGQVLLSTHIQDTAQALRDMVLECFPDAEDRAEMMRSIDVGMNMTLVDYHALHKEGYTQAAISRAIAIQSCPDIIGGEELKYQLALIAWPLNYAAAINYAFALEYSGFAKVAKCLYLDCHVLTGNRGCRYHGIMTAPLFPSSIAEGEELYRNMLSDMYQLLLLPAVPDSGLQGIFQAFREMPVNTHYLGYNPGPVLELFSRALVRDFPSLSEPLTALPAVAADAFPVRKHRIIRFGVVSVYTGNTSPGLCAEDLLRALPAAFPNIHLIFFDRIGLNTFFAWHVKKVAKEVVLLNDQDLLGSADKLRDAHCDVLLYMDVGTEKFAFLLAHMRIAPIQMLFGVGHPISSGLESIDYVVLPQAMLQDSYADGGHGTALQAAYAMHTCTQAHGNCSIAVSKMPYYREQVVRFDSLSHYLAPPHTYLYEPQVIEEMHAVTAQRPTNYTLSCEQIDRRLGEIGVTGLAARELGCRSASDGTVHAKTTHLYNCMQYIKKMHPLFDDVLILLLEKDPLAKILVVDKFSAQVLPRLMARAKEMGHSITSQWSFEQFQAHLLEVPRRPHADFLLLGGLSGVFLVPFPYGTGITSSESLSLCTPVVVMTGRSATINFALAQVRMLGLDELFAADTVEEYVDIAMQSAADDLQAICNRSSANSEECLQHGHVKDLLCAKKHLLFDQQVVDEVVAEWGQFITRVAAS